MAVKLFAIDPDAFGITGRLAEAGYDGIDGLSGF